MAVQCVQARDAKRGLKYFLRHRFLGRESKHTGFTREQGYAIVIKLAPDSCRLNADVKRRAGAGQLDEESAACLRFDSGRDFRILQREFFRFAEEVFVAHALAAGLESQAHPDFGRLRRELGDWPRDDFAGTSAHEFRGLRFATQKVSREIKDLNSDGRIGLGEAIVPGPDLHITFGRLKGRND